jgi:hypothetical protein
MMFEVIRLVLVLLVVDKRRSGKWWKSFVVCVCIFCVLYVFVRLVCLSFMCCVLATHESVLNLQLEAKSKIENQRIKFYSRRS